MTVQPRPGHGSDQRDEQKKENAYKGSQSASVIAAHDGGDIRDRAACGGDGRPVSMTDVVCKTVIMHRIEPMRDLACDHVHGSRDATRHRPTTQNTSVDVEAARGVLMTSTRLRVAARPGIGFSDTQPGPQGLCLAWPWSPTCSTLSPSWGLSEAAPRARLVRHRGLMKRNNSLPSADSLSLLLPVSGRAGARASTVLLTWRSRAFGGGALRQRPTGRISQRRR